MRSTDNYIGRLKVRYMMQQRMISKEHEDAHYCAAIFKYARQFALLNKEHCTFLCTDDKHKISVGEPETPLSALPRGKRVLVGANEYFRVADHDYSLISLTPTVILLNEIPEDIDGSWYCDHPKVGIKITALCPSTKNLQSRKNVDIFLILLTVNLHKSG